ncbi:endonuclease domain-containing 1 protein-like [Tachysurus fulvidraco]|uniref:endonuclease domain-containing 1 protein-like n=1 Tax=Tachysurus fulvidraco TaxID=1234273 RepID=UPI001FF0197D|nr:endonuclease domain-containing 1 protein-like [Tachysurus fulvidraco]
MFNEFWRRARDQPVLLQRKIAVQRSPLVIISHLLLNSNIKFQQLVGVCSDFFIHKENDIIIPTVFPGDQCKTIRQRWKNKYRFATVYDTVRRILVYSAYTFSGREQKSRSNEWKIEPQAVDSDYSPPAITRGHVFPYQFAADQEQADSTFTLSNAAPQTEDSNQKWATQVEKPIHKEIKQGCKLDQSQVYFVTGVVPGRNWISITRDGKEYQAGINIPSHFWSAYCCTNNKEQLVARAYIAEQENFKITKHFNKDSNIQDLNTELTKLHCLPFSVFTGLDLT